MKKRLFCILLLLCFAVTMLAACEDDPMDKIPDELQSYVVTDEDGSIVTDEEGKPVIDDSAATGRFNVYETDDPNGGWSPLYPFDK